MILIDDYRLEYKLGSGSFADVYYTTRKSNNNLSYATKKVEKAKALSEKMKTYFFNEIDILKNTSHVNIIKLFEIKNSMNNFYLIMEYCNGGNLSEIFEKYNNKYNKPFPEIYVQHILRQIACGLFYLHKCNIIHRDIKMENILLHYETPEDLEKLNVLNAKIKIIDFGFAKYLTDCTIAKSICGSPINMDPIILKALAFKQINNDFGYNEKADMWSLGIMVYSMLIGRPPFLASNYQDLFTKINQGNYHIPKYLKLSKQAISLINGLLQFEMTDRLGIEQIVFHEFLSMDIKNFEYFDLNINNCIGNLVLNSKDDITKIWDVYQPIGNMVLSKIRGNLSGVSIVNIIDTVEDVAPIRRRNSLAPDLNEITDELIRDKYLDPQIYKDKENDSMNQNSKNSSKNQESSKNKNHLENKFPENLTKLSTNNQNIPDYGYDILTNNNQLNKQMLNNSSDNSNQLLKNERKGSKDDKKEEEKNTHINSYQNNYNHKFPQNEILNVNNAYNHIPPIIHDPIADFLAMNFNSNTKANYNLNSNKENHLTCNEIKPLPILNKNKENYNNLDYNPVTIQVKNLLIKKEDDNKEFKNKTIEINPLPEVKSEKNIYSFPKYDINHYLNSNYLNDNNNTKTKLDIPSDTIPAINNNIQLKFDNYNYENLKYPWENNNQIYNFVPNTYNNLNLNSDMKTNQQKSNTINQNNELNSYKNYLNQDFLNKNSTDVNNYHDNCLNKNVNNEITDNYINKEQNIKNLQKENILQTEIPKEIIIYKEIPKEISVVNEIKNDTLNNLNFYSNNEKNEIKHQKIIKIPIPEEKIDSNINENKIQFDEKSNNLITIKNSDFNDIIVNPTLIANFDFYKFLRNVSLNIKNNNFDYDPDSMNFNRKNKENKLINNIPQKTEEKIISNNQNTSNQYSFENLNKQLTSNTEKNENYDIEVKELNNKPITFILPTNKEVLPDIKIINEKINNDLSSNSSNPNNSNTEKKTENLNNSKNYEINTNILKNNLNSENNSYNIINNVTYTNTYNYTVPAYNNYEYKSYDYYAYPISCLTNPNYILPKFEANNNGIYNNSQNSLLNNLNVTSNANETKKDDENKNNIDFINSPNTNFTDNFTSNYDFAGLELRINNIIGKYFYSDNMNTYNFDSFNFNK